MEFTVKGLLKRISDTEKIKQFDFDVYIHPKHDPGVFKYSHELLRGLSQVYQYSIALLDHEGSGQEDQTREEIEQVIENNLV